MLCNLQNLKHHIPSRIPTLIGVDVRPPKLWQECSVDNFFDNQRSSLEDDGTSWILWSFLYRKSVISSIRCVGLRRNTSPEISVIIGLFFVGEIVLFHTIQDFASTSWECHVRFAAANRFLHIFGQFSPTWSWLSMGNPPRDFPGYLHQWMFLFFFIGDSIRPCLEDDDLWLLKKGKGVSDDKQWLYHL